MNKSLENRLKLIAGDSNVRCDEPMSSHCTFRAGGTAKYYVIPDEYKKVRDVLRLCVEENIPYYVIGNGSNLLVSDDGIKGIVLKIEIKKLEIEEINNKFKITVGAGVKLGELAQKLANKEISGFEFASGIPGTIGGAIRMNAGAHGSEMKDIVKTVTYIDRNGEIHKINNEQAKFEYRNSMFANNEYIIVETELELNKGNKEEIQAKMQEYANFRKEKQPIEYPSAGSTFKRGTDFITAKLIDECGLKGYQIGGAQVSEKHAGFIINKGNATSKDVEELIKYIKQKVYEKFGKEIETEIEIIH